MYMTMRKDREFLRPGNKKKLDTIKSDPTNDIDVMKVWSVVKVSISAALNGCPGMMRYSEPSSFLCW